jgi:ABC-type uncharacterized transport system permease subunit
VAAGNLRFPALRVNSSYMKSFRGFLLDLTLVVAAIAGAALLLVIGLYLAKYPPIDVLVAWTKGAVGSKDDWLRVLKRSTPLIFTGLAAGVAFRSGVFNIGAEGQAILGALGAVTLATRLAPALGPSWIAVPSALAVGALCGAAWAFIAAALERYRGVSVVLSTILLNFIALHLLQMLLEGPLKARTGSAANQSDQFSAAFQLPNIFESSTSSLHAGFFIAIAVVAISWVVQARTTFGFEILVTGLNPTAARLAGMPVAARQFSIMLISGALAGVSGAMQVMAVEGRSLSANPDSYG